MKKSFTLIELLISLAIISVFSGLGLAYYHNYSNQLTLKSEAYHLKKDLELIKKKALSSEKISNCNNFQGYQISLNSNNYQWGILCGDNNNNFQTIKSKTFPDQITITLIPSNNQLIFTPLKVSFPSQINIQIKNTQINQCLMISISENGIINLNETFQNC